MKKNFYFFAIFFTLLTQLEAFELDCGWDAQLRIAGFHPTSELFRDIYEEWGPDYQIEVSKEINNVCSLWVNGAYLYERGHSLGLHDPTTIHVAPISTGIKYSYRFAPCLNVYAGVGVSYTFLRIWDDSIVLRHTRREGFGGLFKLGAQYVFWNGAFLDLFADYLYQYYRFHDKEHISRHNVNVGGLKFGIGFGQKI